MLADVRADCVPHVFTLVPIGRGRKEGEEGRKEGERRERREGREGEKGEREKREKRERERERRVGVARMSEECEVLTSGSAM